MTFIINTSSMRVKHFKMAIEQNKLFLVKLRIPKLTMKEAKATLEFIIMSFR